MADSTAKAQSSGTETKAEVSGSGVEVTPATASPKASDFQVTKVYRGDETREATSLSELYQLEFDGFSQKQPKKTR